LGNLRPIYPGYAGWLVYYVLLYLYAWQTFVQYTLVAPVG
jgi:hypothetical protein